MQGFKRKKKYIGIVVIVFAVLMVCYLIGQNIVLPKRMAKEGYTDYEGKMPQYSFMQNINLCSFGGKTQLDDVPGGMSIGTITLDSTANVTEDWYGSYVFMTPETSMANRLKIDHTTTRLEFMYGMHPWIKEDVSDGALLSIEIYTDENKKAIIRKEYTVMPGEKMTLADIDISKYQGKEITIGFSCTAGENKDDSGDWVLIEYTVLK